MNDLTTLPTSETPSAPSYDDLNVKMADAYRLVDDIVLKNYITKLTELKVFPPDEKMLANNLSENVCFFKINEMVYAKDEYAAYKFASVFNAAQNMDCAVFIIADSDGRKTDFYMGVRSVDSKRTKTSLRDTLKNALSGQFPGIKTRDLVDEEAKEVIEKIEAKSIASVSCVANNKDDEVATNQNFLQGLEKMTLAMVGQKYTAIVIANGATGEQINEVRKGYENIYTQLSPFANMQIGYGRNDALSVSSAFSNGSTRGTSHADTISDTQGTSKSDTESTSTSDSVSKESWQTKLFKGVVAFASVALVPATAGVSLAVGGALIAGTGSTQKTKSNSSSHSKSTTENFSQTTGETNSTNESTSETNTHTKGLTSGTSEDIQLTLQNKSIINTLERIDLQLKRLQECESLGMWECAAYFLSDSQESAEMAASTYKALMKGKNSGVEVSAVNFWGRSSAVNTELIKDYVTNFMHPVFSYGDSICVTPCSLVSGNELAIHMGLPRKSVCGLPVVEHADFGKEVVHYDNVSDSKTVNLGKVFNMGSESKTDVKLDRNSLTMHTFITGSTGSGKSNTIYEILDQMSRIDIPFLVIEPAKGEYKNVFGNRSDLGVIVLGTNPEYSELLKINPFRFPKKIHILEHVDRLIEIFNVCWPMYAAMPAILKDAVLQAYQACGWDLGTSKNPYSDEMFPTFADLQDEIMNVIQNSAYSQELKSNYIGSLVTRIKSLTNGLNGQIFNANETKNEVLFDKNVIVDLSRVGSLETKSLIMGILIMRLNEHRVCFSKGMNLPLRHITVLEEAHHILKRTSTEQNSESPNMIGKSVEMLSNCIAEMRTYGEGFILADQSPNAVDMSAIRNTNTKIVMRLPDESDRRLAGKASALKDEQLDEISKLPKGVAVVYQNDWLEPVLCKITKFKGKENPFKYNNDSRSSNNNAKFNTELVKLLLKGRLSDDVVVDANAIERLLDAASISTKNKLGVRKLLNEYGLTGKLALWQTDRFGLLAELISELLGAKTKVNNAVVAAENFESLNIELVKFIKSSTSDLPKQVIAEICHAFMRQNSESGQDRLEIYSAWKSFVEKGGEVG